MKDIIFYGVNDWRDIKQRPQHLAERLAEKHRIVYLNPVGYSVLTHLRRRMCGGTHRSWRPHIERLTEHLWVFTPSPALPFSRRFRILNRLNQALLASQLKPLLAQMGMEHPLLWISFPPAVDLVGRLNERHVIVDFLDHYQAFFTGLTRNTVAAMEKELLRRADIVFATSRLLLEECHRINPDVHLVPNGVDASFFGRNRSTLPEPEEFGGLSHPRFGFVGTISRWTDVDILVELALKAPGASVIVIGPWEVPRPFFAPRNFYVLGPRPYQRLPEYLSSLDVGVIPFKMGPLADAINPVKLFEYAAAGLRIVAMATKELMHYSSWCTLADSPYAFITAALREGEEALREKNDDRLARRGVSFAKANDWDDRVTRINRLLEALTE